MTTENTKQNNTINNKQNNKNKPKYKKSRDFVNKKTDFVNKNTENSNITVSNTLENNQVNDENKLDIQFVGGIREIGRNSTLFHYKQSTFLLDCGANHKNPSEAGYKILLPDIDTIIKYVDRIKAIFITHGHEDHIGGLCHLFRKIKKPIKIYSGKFTCELIKETFRMQKDSFFDKLIENIYPIQNNSEIVIDNVSFRFVHVTHSIPDSYFVFMKGGFGTLLHTGDWKFDFTPIGYKTSFDRIIKHAGNGVDLLISDSTRVSESGISETERVVVDSLDNAMRDHVNKRLFVILFGSNVNRILKIISLARKYNRKIFIDGYSIAKAVTAATKAGLTQTKDLWHTTEKINTFNKSEILVLCSGTQGEKSSSTHKLADGKHKYIRNIDNKDVFIFSSDIIPGCAKNVFYCINNFMEKQATVMHRILDKKYYNLHVSGHGSEKDVHLLFNLVKPKFFVPVHGEYHHMFANKNNAINCGLHPKNVFLISNGDTISLNQKSCKHLVNAQYHEYLLDNNSQVISYSDVLKKRRVFANGLYTILLTQKQNIPQIFKVDSLVKNDSELFTVELVTNLNEKLKSLKNISIKDLTEFFETFFMKEKREKSLDNVPIFNIQIFE